MNRGMEIFSIGKRLIWWIKGKKKGRGKDEKRVCITFSVLLLVAPSMINSYQVAADVIETEKIRIKKLLLIIKRLLKILEKKQVKAAFRKKTMMV